MKQNNQIFANTVPFPPHIEEPAGYTLLDDTLILTLFRVYFPFTPTSATTKAVLVG